MASVEKPEKPYKTFPLYAHASGRWAKKIRGKTHFFGPWRDPDKAEALFHSQVEDLKAGRVPRVQRDVVTVVDIVNAFLTVKENLKLNGELSPRTYHDYYAMCERVLEQFGKTRLASDLTPGDFDKLRVALSKTRGPVALGNEVQRVKILFKFGYDNDLLEKPVKFGSHFKRPAKRVLQRARNAKGERMFEASEIRSMLAAVGPQLRAMILLGAQAGIGNHDVSLLPITALDLESGWLNYPRHKTEVKRRIPLMPETVIALKAALESRPKPKLPADANLVFLTRTGRRWITQRDKGVWVDSLAMEMWKLLGKLDLRRPGLGYYALRHGFETVGGESRDQAAVTAIMGHTAESGDMSAVYRERISDERLQAVVETVRRWLWPEGSEAAWMKAEAKRAKQKAKADRAKTAVESAGNAK